MREKGLKPVSFTCYKKLITAMGDTMSDILLKDGIIALPWHNGDIYFKKKKSPPVVDHKASKELGKEVLNFNDHTDGYVYEPTWLSPYTRKKKTKTWVFSIFRNTKRKQAYLLKNHLVDYPDYNKIKPRVMNAT
jgi:hypothetical protein